MHCQCVRQSELPNTSRLFADVLYNPDRTGAFYAHPLRDLESYRAAAAEASKLPAIRRELLIRALRVQNAGSPALEKLAQPDTVAVVTGQQVGLFSGPCYTIYKVLHAVRLAAWLSDNGIAAVPVFWLATEDHDFAEVNHAWVYDSNHHPSRLEMRRSAAEQPVGGVTLEQPPLNELRLAMAGLPFAEEVVAEVEAAYTPGTTMGQAFQSLLRRLLSRFDILYLDPMLPEFRELAAPALARAVEAAPQLTAEVLERNRALAAAGYHAQVHVEETTSLFFLLENGKRLALRRNGSDFTNHSRRLSASELISRASSLSPNALLRPVIQDSMVPTVAYIGGPAEVAYLAQSAVLYMALLGRQPLAVPRTGFTVMDGRAAKLMDRYRLALPDFFHGETVLRERIAARLIPPTLHDSTLRAQADVSAAIARLHAELRAFDPTLAQSLDRSANKIKSQMEKMSRKAGREALRRDQRAAADAGSLYGLIFPERTLQERLYSFLPLLAEHGLNLTQTVHDAIELDCPDHRLMVV
jgi:bacillithiol biosynthesis cysteine-adding enzyme BshC